MVAGSSVSWLDLTGPLAFLFGTIATTIFYSLLLFLIGHALQAIAGPGAAAAEQVSQSVDAEAQESADGLVFQSLDEVEAGKSRRGGRRSPN
jgi:hypothetical protein